MPKPQGEVVLANLTTLTDTNLHSPTTDPTLFNIASIIWAMGAYIMVENTTDQTVRVQPYGNIGRANATTIANAVTRPVSLGTPIDALTADQQLRSFSKWTDSLPPIIYCTVQALVLPTTGAVKVTLVYHGIEPGFVGD